MAIIEPQSADNRKSKKRKIIIAVLAFALFSGMGTSIGLLWRQLPTNRSEQGSGNNMNRKLVKLLLEKYSDAGQFNEAFRLLNEALQQNPDDPELQQELEELLVKKQESDREQKDATKRSQHEFSASLMEQNAVLQRRSDALQQQLSRQFEELQRDNREDRHAPREEQQKRKAEAKELLRQGQEALARSLKASQEAQNSQASVEDRQKARETANAAGKEAKDKAVQALELDSGSPSARKLLEQAQAALRQNESQEQQKNRQNMEGEVEYLRKELTQARKKKNSIEVDKLIDKILSKEPLDDKANTAKAKRIEETEGTQSPAALKNAESAYRKALAGNPEQKEALAGLAQNLDHQARLEEAVKAYDKALENIDAPYDNELAYSKGIALYRLGKFQKAVDSFNDYLQQGGKNLRAYYSLGLSYQRLERSRKAQEAYQEGIAKGLLHAPTFWELSKLQLDTGKANTALASVNSALALKSEDSRYLQTKGTILFALKRYEEAAVAYAEAEKAGKDLDNSERGQVSYNMGLSYYNSSQFPEAEGAFTKAVSLDKEKAEYILGLADTQLASGDRDAAQKTLATAESQFPDNIDLLLTHGNILLKLQQYEESLQVFQKAYKKAPQNRKVINNLGLAYMNTERFDQSREFFRKAIAGDSTNSTLWFNLALVNVATKKHAEATDNLEQTISLDSKMSEAYNLLIKEYLATERKAEAVEILERLRRADPSYSKIAELERLLKQ